MAGVTSWESIESQMMNEHLLKIETTVEEYLAVVSVRPVIKKKHQALLPTYKVAECPFCQTDRDCLAHLDTYSLLRWSNPVGDWGALGTSTKCPHLVITQYFINLNGLEPKEKKYFSNVSEIPFVNTRLLFDFAQETDLTPRLDDMDPCVVMHALPICRIEAGSFVPRYTLFTFVYYARYREPMLEHFKRGQKDFGRQMPGRDMPDRELWWDLNHWAQQKKLHWLDASQPILPRVSHPAPFPYGNIKGHKAFSLTYRDGEISPIESTFYSW